MPETGNARATAAAPGASLRDGPLRAAWGLAGLAAAAHAAAFLYVSLRRIAHPYELEWMEGGALEHILQMLEGRPLYAKPSLDYTAYIYTPLYFWVCLPLVKLAGVSFLPMRLVSFAAALGTMALLFGHVRRETGRGSAGIFAGGIFAATFPLSGSWFDLARVDSLFLFLLLAGTLALRRFPGRAGWTAGGILLALAFLTKQTALVPALGLLPWAVYSGGRRAMWGIGAFIALAGGVCAAMQWASGGWFGYYVFHLPAADPLHEFNFSGFWGGAIAQPLPVALGLGVLALAAAGAGRDWDRLLHLGGFAAGCFAVSWAGGLHQGGYFNVNMPAHAALALLAGFGLDAARRGIAEALRLGERRLAEFGLILALLFQFSLLPHPIGARIPTSEDRAAGDRLVRWIRDYPGEVLIPNGGYLTRMAGRRGAAPGLALHVVLVDEPVTRDFKREVESALADGRYSAVLLDTKGWWTEPWFEEVLRRHYEERERIMDGVVFFPVTGCPARPEYLFTRKNAPEAGGGTTPSAEATTTARGGGNPAAAD